MLFKEWLLLNENIESNFDTYLSNLVKYAKPEEKNQLDSHRKISAYLQTPEQERPNLLWFQKSIIIQVLKLNLSMNFNSSETLKKKRKFYKNHFII